MILGIDLPHGKTFIRGAVLPAACVSGIIGPNRGQLDWSGTGSSGWIGRFDFPTRPLTSTLN